MESPKGKIRQGAFAGQNCESDPDEELLLDELLLELLEEELLDEELDDDEELLELLDDELLEEELLEEELLEVVPPPHAVRETAMATASQYLNVRIIYSSRY